MTIDKIRDYHGRRPFVRFDIRASDGRVYTVDHPEFLMQSCNGRTVSYTRDDDREIVIDVTHITSLEVANSTAA